MKKQKKNDRHGTDPIINKIKNVFLKCIRLGQKRMWIKAAPSGENTADGHALEILILIRSIMSVIERTFFIKRKSIIEREKA